MYWDQGLDKNSSRLQTIIATRQDLKFYTDARIGPLLTNPWIRRKCIAVQNFNSSSIAPYLHHKKQHE